MEVQTNFTTQFRRNAKLYQALIKVNTYFNGYSVAKVIIDNEQYWALYNGVSWQLMLDTRKNKHFDRPVLNYLKAITKALTVSKRS